MASKRYAMKVGAATLSPRTLIEADTLGELHYFVNAKCQMRPQDYDYIDTRENRYVSFFDVLDAEVVADDCRWMRSL